MVVELLILGVVGYGLINCAVKGKASQNGNIHDIKSGANKSSPTDDEERFYSIQPFAAKCNHELEMKDYEEKLREYYKVEDESTGMIVSDDKPVVEDDTDYEVDDLCGDVMDFILKEQEINTLAISKHFNIEPTRVNNILNNLEDCCLISSPNIDNTRSITTDRAFFESLFPPNEENPMFVQCIDSQIAFFQSEIIVKQVINRNISSYATYQFKPDVIENIVCQKGSAKANGILTINFNHEMDWDIEDKSNSKELFVPNSKALSLCFLETDNDNIIDLLKYVLSENTDLDIFIDELE